VTNPGNPASLVPAEQGNTRTLKHAAYSPRMREPRAREIAERVMQAPWASDLDELGALEIGRLEALVEAIDAALSDGRVEDGRGRPRALIDMRLKASRRLQEWYILYGLVPHARAAWAKQLADGGIVGEIARRREQAERERAERSNGVPG
jgi:hypothetical protein